MGSSKPYWEKIILNREWPDFAFILIELRSAKMGCLAIRKTWSSSSYVEPLKIVKYLQRDEKTELSQ